MRLLFDMFPGPSPPRTGFRRVPFVIVLLCACGCITPRNTRFPSCIRPHPAAERLSWERSDPLFDPAIGPDLNDRPRDFRTPRTIERRAAQNRILYGQPVDPDALPPVPVGRRYPDAVR